MNSDDEIAVLNSALKKRKEASAIYRQAGRIDLAEQEDLELAIIQQYLPKQLSASEVESEIRKILTSFGPASSKDFGKVMPLVMKELKGKGDGKTILETVKKLLGE
jgi:hypothetical protein